MTMRTLTARSIKTTACEKAKEIFKDKIFGEISAVYTSCEEKNVICVCGLKFYAPVADIACSAIGKYRSLEGESLLLFIKDNSLFVISPLKGSLKLPEECYKELYKLISGAKSWGGEINDRGEHVCDLKSPSPGPNYYTNMLLGNRLSFGNVLQCTPKSVVDRLGRGSFRSHADTQVLAARWDYRPEENGFPANRQFYIIEDGKLLFYSADPSDKRIKEAKCIHSQNKTEITYLLSCGLEIKRTIFLLPQKEKMPMAAEAQIINILNRGKSDRNLKIVYTGMFSNASTICLKEDIIYMTVIEESETVFDDCGNLAAVTYHYNPEYEQSDLRFHTSVAHIGNRNIFPTEFCFDYNTFIGNGNLENPDSVCKLNCCHVRKGPAFFAVSIPFVLKTDENAQIDNLTCLTSEKDHLKDYKAHETMLEEIKTVNEFLSDKSSLPNAVEEVKEFTQKYTSFLRLNDTDREFERYVNKNLPYQVFYQNFVSRSFDQTQKGYREIGFREIQDIFASMYYWIGIDRADIVKDFITQWAENIYKMGYANHNFFWNGKEAGVSSDDQLWLIQAVSRYVALTNDYEFLNKKIAVADGGERALINTIGTIIEYSSKISVGKHGLPLNDAADWNDCLRVDPDCLSGKEKEKRYKIQIENGGKWGDRFESEGSESVMNGFLLKVAVDAAQKLYCGCKMNEKAKEMETLSKELYDNLQKNAWKQDFFCRLLFNRSDKPGLKYLGAGGDGLSSDPDKNGTYFINSFAWSVLSGVSTDEQIETMLDTLEKNVKTPFGFQLSSEVNYKRIANRVSASNFFFGDRENGGIFKHANMMLAASMVKAANEVEDDLLAERLCDTAYWLIEKTVPYACLKSPFKICGNPRFCTQYNNADTGENIGPTLSGTSSWLLLTITQLLGINVNSGKLTFSPLLKKAEKEKRYELKLGKTFFDIRIIKPIGFYRIKSRNYTLLVDGKSISADDMTFYDDGLKHTVVLSFK